MVGVLIEQKTAGNASENGFKMAVWAKVVVALEGLHANEKLGAAKEQKQCKAKFQRVHTTSMNALVCIEVLAAQGQLQDHKNPLRTLRVWLG